MSAPPVDIEMGRTSGDAGSDRSVGPPEQQATCWGRGWNRVGWSHVPLTVNMCAVPAIFTVGGAFTALYFDEIYVLAGFVVTGIAVDVCLCVPCLEVCHLRPLRGLSHQVDRLGKENEKLEMRKNQLKSEVERLQATKAKFDEGLKEAEESRKELEKLLGKQTSELKGAAAQMNVTHQKFLQLKGFFQDFKGVSDEAQKKLAEFKEANRQLAKQSHELAKNNDDLEEQNDRISDGVDGIDRENEEMAQQLKDFEDLINKLTGGVSTFEETLDDMDPTLQKLGEYAAQLDEADDKIRDGGHQLNETTERLGNDVLPQSAEVVEHLGKLLRDLSDSGEGEVF